MASQKGDLTFELMFTGSADFAVRSSGKCALSTGPYNNLLPLLTRMLT